MLQAQLRFGSTDAAQPAMARQASGVQLTSGEPPPPGYYAQNLRVLTAQVGVQFGTALDAATRHFVDAIAQLPEPAVRLLARLAARKGQVFRRDSLRYAEVTQLDAAIADLSDAQLLVRQAPVPADQLLGLARVAELQQWFPYAFRSRTRWRKAERLEVLLASYSDRQLRSRLSEQLTWLALTCTPALQRCQLLYFGDRYQDLSAFVTEDLGLVRYPSYPLSPPDWWNGTAQCLQQHEQLHRCAGASYRLDPTLRQTCYALELVAVLQALPVSREQRQVRDRALLRLGQYLERVDAPDAALQAYQLVQRHPARERRVRLLHKQQQKQAAQALLQQLRAQPLCAAEADFAERFGKRLPAYSALTEASIVGATPARIEQFAAQLLLANGGSAWHVENRLPLGIAGLLYWDAIFAPVPGMFTRPFQMAPLDLRWPDFASARKAEISALESQWQGTSPAAAAALAAQLRRTVAEQQGTANPLVAWHLFEKDFIDHLLSTLGPATLARLGAFVIRELGRFHNGFPDLLVTYPDGSFECVEVKGPGDQLQRAQRRWLHVLQSLAIPARVFKLRPARL